MYWGVNILRLHVSMVCPTWHTWGRCWKRRGTCCWNLPQGVGLNQDYPSST